MQAQRFLTLPELLQTIRFEQRLSVPEMAARSQLPPPTYVSLEQGKAPTRDLFDSLIGNLPVLAAMLMGTKTDEGEGVRARIRHLQALPPETQQIELARIRFELAWLDVG